MKTSRKELLRQTQEQHDAWMKIKQQEIERAVRTWQGRLSITTKKHLEAHCAAYGIAASTPGNMRVALYYAYMNSEQEALRIMHKMWLQAPGRNG